MTEATKFIFFVLGSYGVVSIFNLIMKTVVTVIICRHPNLSNQKVNYITRMFYKDKSNRKK